MAALPPELVVGEELLLLQAINETAQITHVALITGFIIQLLRCSLFFIRPQVRSGAAQQNH